MDERVQGYWPPREDGPRRYRVVRPKLNCPVLCTLLAERWVGIAEHYDDGVVSGRMRSYLCVGVAACEYCRLGHRTRAGGYIPAWDLRQREVIVLALPRDTVDAVLSHRDGKGGMLGLTLLLTRMGHAKGPINVETKATTPASLRDGGRPDIWPTLVAVYGPRVMLPRAPDTPPEDV